MTPKTSCIIAATPRSGSWLLCETLATTGLVGEPQEYFNTRLIPGWREHFDMRPGAGFLRYIKRVVGYGTGDNGIFSVKLHWTQLTAFADKVRSQPGEWPADDGALLECFFPDVRYVFIRRGDTARQAISYWRATQTRTWWDVEGDAGQGEDPGGSEAAGGPAGVALEDLEPDFRQIRWMEDMLIDQDRLWAEHISRHGVPWVEVIYEDFVIDRLAALHQVHALLDVPVPVDVTLPAPKLKKQSDDQTEEWLIAYQAIRDTLPSIPSSAYWSPAANQLVAGDSGASGPKTGRRARANRPPRRPTPPAVDDPGGAARSTDELPWSFRYIIDDRGHDTGFGALRSPVGDDELDFLKRFRAERRTLGWASYGTYPKIHRFFDGPDMAGSGLHGRERDYLNGLKGWAHCFRHADAFLPRRVPRALLSESDFTDITEVRRTGLAGGRPAKRWDVIYVCCPNGFNERTKNWRLAKRCLTALSEQLGTTALLVGRKDAPDVPDVPGIETTDELPWDELMGCLAQARTLLVPNRLDASPVLLTEALCLDVPVVVNRRILGGWKYVVAETGRLFTDEQDVTDAVAACLRGDFATSAWFRTFYGPDNAGRRLAEFLRTILRAEQSGTQRSLPAWRHAHLASEIP